MAIDLETIKRKKAYNDYLELAKNLSFNTEDGLVESEKIVFSRYQTRDAILRLTDFHNKSLGKYTITDLGNLKEYECTNLYRNLNMSLNLQITLRDKEFLGDFINELNNIATSLGSIEGLESTLLTAISRAKKETINSRSTLSLLNNFNTFGLGSKIAAGHNSGFYYNSMSSEWRNFTHENLTGYGDELYNLKNNWNNLGYSISRNECINITKYASASIGAGFALGLSIGGTAGTGGLAAPSIPSATTGGFLTGMGIGQVIGEAFCEKPNTSSSDTDTDTDDDLDNIDLEALERAQEAERKEKGCIVNPEYANMKFKENEFMFHDKINSYYLKGPGIKSFIKETNGSFKIKDMPRLHSNIGNINSKLNFNLGFMREIPSLKDVLKNVINDKILAIPGQIYDVPQINLEQFRDNNEGLILTNGEILPNQGSDVIMDLTHELESVNTDEIRRKLEEKINDTNFRPTVAFSYVIDDPNIDNDIEENHTMHTIFISSPTLRKKIGNSITVSELGLQGALDELEKMQTMAVKIDAITNWGNLDME